MTEIERLQNMGFEKQDAEFLLDSKPRLLEMETTAEIVDLPSGKSIWLYCDGTWSESLELFK